MKYLVLIYSSPESWGHPTFARTAELLAASPEEQDELMARFGALMKEIHESGELIDSAPLADPSDTKTVRVRDGVPAVTDGPYGEAKELLAGYFVLDCENLERAIEIAGRFPDAEFARVEVRAIMHQSGEEM